MEIPTEEFEKLSVMIGEQCLKVLEELMHDRKCFPLMGETRVHVLHSHFTCARAVMSTMAKFILEGDDIRKAFIPDDTRPNPPTPL